jgi:16S rRNA A1518/A1519 N6-dimethyltransferase RsmA/KsgA/DIM1 with predicted DNA glycosylase/AP lyase activity
MNDVTLEIGCGSLAGFLDRIGLTGAARDRVVEIDQTLAAELEKSTIDHDRCSDLVLEVADLVSEPLRGWTSVLDEFDFDAMGWGSDGDEEVDHV